MFGKELCIKCWMELLQDGKLKRGKEILTSVWNVCICWSRVKSVAFKRCVECSRLALFFVWKIFMYFIIRWWFRRSFRTKCKIECFGRLYNFWKSNILDSKSYSIIKDWFDKKNLQHGLYLLEKITYHLRKLVAVWNHLRPVLGGEGFFIS